MFQMTAIAWAIVFIGLIFYGAIYDDKLIALGYDKTLGGLTFFVFVVLVLLTIKKLFS